MKPKTKEHARMLLFEALGKARSDGTSRGRPLYTQETILNALHSHGLTDWWVDA